MIFHKLLSAPKNKLSRNIKIQQRNWQWIGIYISEKGNRMEVYHRVSHCIKIYIYITVKPLQDSSFHLRLAKIMKFNNTICGWRHNHTVPVGTHSNTNAKMEGNLARLTKIKTACSSCSNNSPLVISPAEILVDMQNTIYRTSFTGALFIVANDWTKRRVHYLGAESTMAKPYPGILFGHEKEQTDRRCLAGYIVRWKKEKGRRVQRHQC